MYLKLCLVKKAAGTLCPPPGIIGLKLDLKLNQISDIYSTAFKEMKALKYLDLSQNRLKHVGNLLSENINLEKLYLAGNELEDISSLRLKETRKKLLEISFRGNHLVHITQDLFPNTLRVLDLSENFITSVSVKTFDNMVALNKILLANNYIKSLDPRILIHLERLQLLDIRYNLLSCDCKFAEFVKKCPKRSVILSRCVNSNSTHTFNTFNFDKDKACRNNGICSSKEGQYRCVCSSPYRLCEHKTKNWLVIGLVTAFFCILSILVGVFVLKRCQKLKSAKSGDECQENDEANICDNGVYEKA